MLICCPVGFRMVHDFEYRTYVKPHLVALNQQVTPMEILDHLPCLTTFDRVNISKHWVLVIILGVFGPFKQGPMLWDVSQNIAHLAAFIDK